MVSTWRLPRSFFTGKKILVRGGREDEGGGNIASARIFEQSMGARNRVGLGLSYRPARRNLFLGIDSWPPLPP
jgi:hypothetical protein